MAFRRNHSITIKFARPVEFRDLAIRKQALNHKKQKPGGEQEPYFLQPIKRHRLIVGFKPIFGEGRFDA